MYPGVSPYKLDGVTLPEVVLDGDRGRALETRPVDGSFCLLLLTAGWSPVISDVRL
jgi:hypothetical protein